MGRCIVLAALLTLCFSCKKETGPAAVPSDGSADGSGKKFEMYEMSEMAMLMEQMYVDNERLKQRIQSGDTIGAFPDHFMKIHSAAMTDPSENDAFFRQQATQFIEAQQMIYKDPSNARKHFNDGVDACIGCHQVKCAGPITRIKKLYIK